MQQQLAHESKARLDLALDAAIPDWRIINADPRWLAWLQQIDGLNGVSRQQLLNGAVARGEKPTYTRAQVAALYSAHRRGMYKGREPSRFDTMPSSPILQAWRNTLSPSWARCSFRRSPDGRTRRCRARDQVLP